jgi:hypothetical protein
MKTKTKAARPKRRPQPLDVETGDGTQPIPGRENYPTYKPQPGWLARARVCGDRYLYLFRYEDGELAIGAGDTPRAIGRVGYSAFARLTTESVVGHCRRFDDFDCPTYKVTEAVKNLQAVAELLGVTP